LVEGDRGEDDHCEGGDKEAEPGGLADDGVEAVVGVLEAVDAADEEPRNRDRQGDRDGADDGELHGDSFGSRVWCLRHTLTAASFDVVGRTTERRGIARLDFGRRDSTLRWSRDGPAMDAESPQRR
jgi:hypothetical protein